MPGAPNAKTDIDITFTNDRLENSGHSVSSLSDVNPKQSSESEVRKSCDLILIILCHISLHFFSQSDYLMPIARKRLDF